MLKTLARCANKSRETNNFCADMRLSVKSWSLNFSYRKKKPKESRKTNSRSAVIFLYSVTLMQTVIRKVKNKVCIYLCIYLFVGVRAATAQLRGDIDWCICHGGFICVPCQISVHVLSYWHPNIVFCSFHSLIPMSWLPPLETVVIADYPRKWEGFQIINSTEITL